MANPALIKYLRFVYHSIMVQFKLLYQWSYSALTSTKS